MRSNRVARLPTQRDTLGRPIRRPGQERSTRGCKRPRIRKKACGTPTAGLLYNPDAYRKGPLLASKNSSGKRCVRRSEQAIQGRLGQRRARVSPVSHVRTAAPWIENKRAIDTRWRGRHVRRTRRMKPMPYRRDGGERGIAADLRANASARPLSRETRTRRRSHRSESVDGTIVAPHGVFEKV